jgi:repressor of nif and glnA expression
LSTKLETFLFDFKDDPTAKARFLVRTTEKKKRKVSTRALQYRLKIYEEHLTITFKIYGRTNKCKQNTRIDAQFTNL